MNMHYKNFEYSLKTRRPVLKNKSSELLVELYKIKQKVEKIEEAAKQLEKSLSQTDSEDYGSINALFTATLKQLSSQTSDSSPFDYRVNKPQQLSCLNESNKELEELKHSVRSLQSMLTTLEEQAENQSLSSLLIYIEHVASILDPIFLQQLETKKAVIITNLLKFSEIL